MLMFRTKFHQVVIVAALDGMFEHKGFNNILNLVPHAESVVRLSAVCNYCKCEAHLTRTSDDTEVEVSLLQLS